MKTEETRKRAEVTASDVEAARTSLIRALRSFGEDEEVSRLVGGVETALAHLGISIVPEDE